jgi:hypothetical protein
LLEEEENFKEGRLIGKINLLENERERCIRLLERDLEDLNRDLHGHHDELPRFMFQRE